MGYLQAAFTTALSGKDTHQLFQPHGVRSALPIRLPSAQLHFHTGRCVVAAHVDLSVLIGFLFLEMETLQ